MPAAEQLALRRLSPTAFDASQDLVRRKALMINEYRQELYVLPIVGEVRRYLKETKGKYIPGQPEFGARLALLQAQSSFNPNYGIGDCLVEVREDEGVARYFYGGNLMVTGTAQQRLNHHAETGALESWTKFLDGRKQADFAHKAEPGQFGIRNGFIAYGTLEPCIKCTGEMINAINIARTYIAPDAKLICASLNVDGGYVVGDDGMGRSDGAALVLGKKAKTLPLIWDGIARGSFDFSQEAIDRPLTFTLMHTDPSPLEGYVGPGMYIPTGDKDLENLAWRIFSETRGAIDELLMTGKLPPVK